MTVQGRRVGICGPLDVGLHLLLVKRQRCMTERENSVSERDMVGALSGIRLRRCPFQVPINIHGEDQNKYIKSFTVISHVINLT